MVNPVFARIRNGDALIPLSGSGHAGVKYSPAKNTVLNGEIEIGLDNIYQMRFGIACKLCEMVEIRTGISNNPLCPSWGIGGSFSRFKYALGGNLHPILGTSSCISLNYFF